MDHFKLRKDDRITSSVSSFGLAIGLKPTGKHSAITDCCWSSTGKYVVLGEGSILKIWERTLQGSPSFKHLRFRGHSKKITSVAFSSACDVALSVGEDCTVRVWRPSILGKSAWFKIHSARINHIEMASNGTDFLSCSDDKTIKLYRLSHADEAIATVTFVTSFKGHSNWVRCVKFSPDGKLVYSVGDEGLFRIWELASGRLLHSFARAKGDCKYFDLSPSGLFIAAGVGAEVLVYDTRNCLLKDSLTLPGPVGRIQWHESGVFMTVACSDTIRFVSFANNHLSVDLRVQTPDALTALQFGPGDMLATGDVTGQLALWQFRYRPVEEEPPSPVADAEDMSVAVPPMEIRDGVVRVAVKSQETLPDQLSQSITALEKGVKGMVGMLRVLESRVGAIEDTLACS
ncbi:WD domain, G-beta repeat [Carpediemonas membranifera]|uniref:WD domain, G-beta repeat n=1 Tax=Carpediemonas membranifera TaxID=201153 RepID=A0A8J6E390_9EUKA|nr:WD domain, G-beta repeat [Carpediemonas membranifera]|eukprot:KAG9392827.1 WD domain, G-beta repeat [Carpediemonas membranifera]